MSLTKNNRTGTRKATRNLLFITLVSTCGATSCTLILPPQTNQHSRQSCHDCSGTPMEILEAGPTDTHALRPPSCFRPRNPSRRPRTHRATLRAGGEPTRPRRSARLKHNTQSSVDPLRHHEVVRPSIHTYVHPPIKTYMNPFPCPQSPYSPRLPLHHNPPIKHNSSLPKTPSTTLPATKKERGGTSFPFRAYSTCIHPSMRRTTIPIPIPNTKTNSFRRLVFLPPLEKSS